MTTKCHGGYSISQRRQELKKFLQQPPPNNNHHSHLKSLEDLPEYTSEQVSKRNGNNTNNNEGNRIWMSYGGYVYDVTEFLDLHPGGTERISRAAGAAIEPFWYLHQQHFDTEEPLQILRKLVVGRLAESDQGRIDADLERLQEDLDRFQLQVDFSSSSSSGGPTSTKKLLLSLNDLKKLPQTDAKSQVGCPQNQDRRPVSVSIFGGVRMKDLLASTGAFGKDQTNAAVGRIVFHAMDGEKYTVDVDVDVDTDAAQYQDILVCYEMDGAPLTKSRGFPLRIIIPGKRAVKWVQRIEIISK